LEVRPSQQQANGSLTILWLMVLLRTLAQLQISYYWRCERLRSDEWNVMMMSMDGWVLDDDCDGW
jgi:hypothetical protein